VANDHHLEVFRQGIPKWNAWRAGHVEPPDLSHADLRNTSFVGADLRGANLNRTNLSFADFLKTDLSNATFYEANAFGAKFHNAVLGSARFDEADLRTAHFNGADARGVNFTRANLSRALFERANLSGAHLSEANLTLAWLGGADLRKAYLSHTNLTRAMMTNANLAGAVFEGTAIAAVDLSGTSGLDAVEHHGPSTIGVDTIYMSGGAISDRFLREAGVPDNLIAYIPSLIGAEEGLQFYSCFISYSHSDEEFCKRLYSRMRDEHLRVWFAPEDIEGGRKIHEQIETQIRLYDKLLLVLSPSSMKSNWVATEIYHARQREVKEERQVLFPIALCSYDDIRNWKLFDSDSGRDIAREVREYFIPEFSNWKNHDLFETAFARLIKDLRARTPKSDSSGGAIDRID
jgi:TIR domain/Pentapeptide repeats (9 copies)/Pentapeptide repeats (8 copies)